MKKNPLLAKIEAKHEIELRITRDVTRQEVADLVQSDTPDKEYSIAKFEELVKQVCGDRYSPREVRYGYDL